MASQVRSVNQSHRVSKTYSEAPIQEAKPAVSQPEANPALTALSVEFVAKPHEAQRAEQSIPATIDATLRELGGYAGCLVMISNQEARLITVVTFWREPDGAQRCKENAGWVNALLKPYMDRCLRSQTVSARLPSEAPLRPMGGQKFSVQVDKTLALESDLLSVT